MVAKWEAIETGQPRHREEEIKVRNKVFAFIKVVAEGKYLTKKERSSERRRS